MGEQTELARLPPQSLPQILAVGEQVAPQRQDQHEHVLGHGMHGVVADVGHTDAALPATIEIDMLGAGGGDRDHPEVRQLHQHLAPQRHLVGDGDGGVLQLLQHLFGRAGRILLPHMREGRTPHLGNETRAVQKDDAFRFHFHPRTQFSTQSQNGNVSQNSSVLQPIVSAAARVSSLKRSANNIAINMEGMAASTTAAVCGSASG